MSEPKVPVAAQAAAVREMLLSDKSNASFVDKLAAIKAQYPSYAEGVKQVQQEGEKPARSRSGSAPHEKLGLADMV